MWRDIIVGISWVIAMPVAIWILVRASEYSITQGLKRSLMKAESRERMRILHNGQDK